MNLDDLSRDFQKALRAHNQALNKYHLACIRFILEDITAKDLFKDRDKYLLANYKFEGAVVIEARQKRGQKHSLYDKFQISLFEEE